MNTAIVWVLTALVSNGHATLTIVPTLEFKTKEGCERAIQTFKEDSKDARATAYMRCVRIEK